MLPYVMVSELEYHVCLCYCSRVLVSVCMCEVGRLFTFGSVIIARVLHLCYVSNHVTCVVQGFAVFGHS